MLNVEKIIEKLLLKHDCVIIPTLGGFVTHHEPAYQEKETDMYYPPSRSISFNSQLKMNDGLLAQAYMQAFDTNFPEANRMVESEAERIKRVLHTTGTYIFENLGVLELKESNRLLFTPQDDGGIAAPDLYGLDSFYMKPYEERQEITLGEQTILSKRIEIKGNIQKTDKREHITKRPHYTVHINKNVTNYFAAALVAIVFYFSFAIPVSNNTKGEHSHLSIANGALYGFPIQSIMQQSFSPKSSNRAKQTTSAVTMQNLGDTSKNMQKTVSDNTYFTAADEHVSTQKTKQTKASSSNASGSYYTIVLASSIKEDNALIFVKQLKEAGYGASQVFIKNKMVRVVYSKYTSEEEAQKALNHLRNKDPFNEAWILLIN